MKDVSAKGGKDFSQVLKQACSSSVEGLA